MGHFANIFVFMRLSMFRRNPSVFYLIVESIVDILELAIVFPTRIAINGFGTDLANTSMLWCKLRPFLTQTISLISFNIVCYTAIDQYLQTSDFLFLRQKSSMKTAKLLIMIAIVFWNLHGIVAWVFFEVRPKIGCNIYNPYALNYVTYFFHTTLAGILPIIVSTFFSILAYKNVRRIIRRHIPIRRRKLDQQMTAMILVRVGVFIVMTVPYVVQRIISFGSIVDPSNEMDQAILQLMAAITNTILNINFGAPFYLFIISSERFRRQVRFAFINMCWNVYCRNLRRRNNQVAPAGQCSTGELVLESIQ